MKKFFHAGLVLFVLSGAVAPALYPAAALAADAGSTDASSANDWKAEFDRICGKTNDAMGLSEEELKSLIEECDKLRPSIEALDESTKKVYLKRLKACKDLFSYVLESKQNQGSQFRTEGPGGE